MWKNNQDHVNDAGGQTTVAMLPMITISGIVRILGRASMQSLKHRRSIQSLKIVFKCLNNNACPHL